MTRLPFILRDLDAAVRAIAPNGPAPVLILAPGTFGPVVAELASHYGTPVDPAKDYFTTTGVTIKRDV